MRHKVSHPYKIRLIYCYNGCANIIVAMLLETEFELPVNKELPKQSSYLMCVEAFHVRNRRLHSVTVSGIQEFPFSSA